MTFEDETYGYVVATFCDFGEQNRRDVLAQHLNRGSAHRAFKRLCKIYSHQSKLAGRENWRVWQEDRAGGVVNDSKLTAPKTTAQ